MSDKGIVAAVIAILAAGGTGAYLISRKPTPPPSSNYAITLNGPTSANVNSQKTYNGTVTLNGSPVANATVSLSINNGTPQTTTTDSNGNYSFNVTFSNSGTITLNASSNGASATLTVSVSTSQPTCTSCSDCPSGYNCVNGQCVQLILQSINLPVDYYVPSGYAQFTLLQNFEPPYPFPVSSKTTLVISTTSAKSCPSSYGNASQSNSYEITMSINGSVIDASGRGVSGIDVSGDISGGGSWQVDTSGGTLSGTATPNLESGSITTDCNGNFSFTIKVSITVKYAHNDFASYNTSYYNMDLQSLTLRVSSGALPSATTIISFDEYAAAELCNYTYGVML